MDYQTLSIEELVKECAKNSDPDARGEFVRRFHRRIVHVVSKTCREWAVTSHDVVEDLVNETYIKLWDNNCSLLARFASRYENAFFGYLKSTAASVAWDHFRALHAVKRDVAHTVNLEEASHQTQSSYGRPEVVEIMLFCDEVDQLLLQRGNGPSERRERAIFWLHYRQGLTAKEIAAIPTFKLKIKGVESVIHRLTCFVRRSLLSNADTQAAGK